jgi:hypothetical protein
VISLSTQTSALHPTQPKRAGWRGSECLYQEARSASLNEEGALEANEDNAGRIE